MRRADRRYRGRKPRRGLFFGVPRRSPAERVRWGEETQGSRRRFLRKEKTKQSGLWVDVEQAGIVVLAVLVAILVLTMRANSQYCGKSVGEQVYQAVFVTKDWE